MMKRKIVIISSSYPYGNTETFLENEIAFLAKYYDILVIPIKKKNKNDQPRPVPKNVTFSLPVLSENYFVRLLRGIFNMSPFIPYFIDLIKLIELSKSKKKSFVQWTIRTISNRTLHSSKIFDTVCRDQSIHSLYFYWANFPINIINKIDKNIFVRVHGGEVDIDRNHGYIPMADKVFVNQDNVLYLPISKKAARMVQEIIKVNVQINRLGVYDHGINLSSSEEEYITIVSCSNLIPLKRVHLIVEALREVRKKVRWCHFGDGYVMDKIVQVASELPNNIKVEFKGRVENREVLNFYKNNHIDLFINVSETEGVPVSIMEAMSFGIPCFATDVGGVSEIVNSSIGMLVEKDFLIKELTNYITNIRANSCLYNLRSNARLQWERLSDAKRNYSDLVKILSLKSKLEL